MVRIVGFLILIVSGQAMTQLNKNFNSSRFVMGPPLIYHCIKAVARTLPTRIRPDRIEDLSAKWDTHFAFAISEYMDCNRKPIQSASLTTEMLL